MRDLRKDKICRYQSYNDYLKFSYNAVACYAKQEKIVTYALN